MVNVITTLQALLYAEWIETNPDVADIKFCIQDYGKDTGLALFDPNACYPQIALDETEVKTAYVVDGVYRKEHLVSLIVYLRPTNYQPDTITAAQETFDNMTTHIDTILKDNKYLATNINNIHLSSWTPQTQKQNEPIVFVATQEIKAVYYE